MSGVKCGDVDRGVGADHLCDVGSDTDGAEGKTGDTVEREPFASQLVQIQLGSQARFIGDGLDEEKVQHAMGVVGSRVALGGIKADVLSKTAEAQDSRCIARFLAYLAKHAFLQGLVRVLSAAGQVIADETVGQDDDVEQDFASAVKDCLAVVSDGDGGPLL